MLPSTKRYLVLATLLLIGGMVLYGVTWFVVSGYANTVHASIVEQGVEDQKHQDLKRLEKIFGDTVAERAELSSRIISTDGVSNFLEYIESTARKEGLSITTKSVSLEKIDGTVLFEHLDLSIQVDGTYPQTEKMLALLETMPYQVVVTKATFERAGRGEDSWSGLFDIQVTKEK